MSVNLPKEPPAPVMIPVRRISSKVAIPAGLVAAYLSGIFALRHFGHLSSDGSVGLQIGLAFGLMAATIFVCTRWWRRKDEAQQEAQKWAWYWGGGLGLAAMAPILFAMTFESDHMLDTLLAAAGSAGSVTMAFKLGVVAVLVPMLAGALIARTVWWRRRR